MPALQELFWKFVKSMKDSEGLSEIGNNSSCQETLSVYLDG